MITLLCFLLPTLGVLGLAKYTELFVKLAIAGKFQVKNVTEAPQEGPAGAVEKPWRGSHLIDYKWSNRCDLLLSVFYGTTNTFFLKILLLEF